MKSLNERIKQLEDQVNALQTKTKGSVDDIEEKYQKPISTVGNDINPAGIRPADITSGRGNAHGGNLLWHSEELSIPPVGVEPTDPSTVEGAKGYHKHSHSRFTGGALIKDIVEIVEYDFIKTPVTNKYSPQYWINQPKITTEVNSSGHTIDKIGKLDLIFNVDTGTWGVAAYEIDIKKCYLVERDSSGVIALDSKGQQKRSPLYNSDTTKTSIVWDENGNCWRFYAAYAD